MFIFDKEQWAVQHFAPDVFEVGILDVREEYMKSFYSDRSSSSEHGSFMEGNINCGVCESEFSCRSQNSL